MNPWIAVTSLFVLLFVSTPLPPKRPPTTFEGV